MTYISLGLGDMDANLSEAGEELAGVALSVAIHGVEVSENSSETSDGLGTSGIELGSELVENYYEQKQKLEKSFRLRILVC